MPKMTFLKYPGLDIIYADSILAAVQKAAGEPLDYLITIGRIETDSFHLLPTSLDTQKAILAEIEKEAGHV